MSILPEKSIDEDFLILLGGRIVPRKTVRAVDKVLEVDVETAWWELGPIVSWNNEVTVTIYMNW